MAMPSGWEDEQPESLFHRFLRGMGRRVQDDTDVSTDDAEKEGGGGGCFSETTTVQVQGKSQPVSMKDLQVGDVILTGDGSYESVYAFGHLDQTIKANFLQIQIDATQNSLEMTGEHLIFVEGKSNPVRADSLQVGDVLQGQNGAAEVSKIRTVKRTGLYAPLTPSGSIMVDGIKASSYISLQKDAAEYVEFRGGISTGISQQTMVHMFLSPFRILCMGGPSTFCQSYNEQGMPHFVANGLKFAESIQQLHILAQIMVFMVIVAIMTGVFVLESVIGASMLPTVLVTVLAVWSLLRATNIRVRSVKIKTV